MRGIISTINLTHKPRLDIFLIESFSTDFLPPTLSVEKFSTEAGNTEGFSTTLASKTVLRNHLLKIFLGGDEKDFSNLYYIRFV